MITKRPPIDIIPTRIPLIYAGYPLSVTAVTNKRKKAPPKTPVISEATLSIWNMV